jgi:anaerobic selenocysteine-containing dehydrogenase
MELMQYAQSEPRAMKMIPFVLAKTLGPALGSSHMAALWALLQAAPASFREHAARAGFDPGMKMGEDIFQALLAHPEGVWIGKCDPQNNLGHLHTGDKKINLVIPELTDLVRGIDAASEEMALVMDPEYPLILMAGRHFDHNANTVMRDPAWNGEREYCTLLMHPSDAQFLALTDGEMVRVKTEAGEELIKLEITDTSRPGHVVIPHGFGLVHQGKTYGANVNRLAKSSHRDPIAATPLHRFVPCRVEKM